ncbi:hypothetical protein STEG23_015406, partial [Scotinomys teguina]
MPELLLRKKSVHFMHATHPFPMQHLLSTFLWLLAPNRTSFDLIVVCMALKSYLSPLSASSPRTFSNKLDVH